MRTLNKAIEETANACALTNHDDEISVGLRVLTRDVGDEMIEAKGASGGGGREGR